MVQNVIIDERCKKTLRIARRRRETSSSSGQGEITFFLCSLFFQLCNLYFFLLFSSLSSYRRNYENVYDFQFLFEASYRRACMRFNNVAAKVRFSGKNIVQLQTPFLPRSKQYFIAQGVRKKLNNS